MYFFLTIGGFNIKVIYPDTVSEETIPIIGEIKTRLSDFVISKNLLKIDFTIKIHLICFHSIVTVKKQQLKDTYYYLYFYKEQNNVIHTYYHISIEQFYYLLLMILTKLLRYNNGFMMHASAVDVDKKAVIFTGKSGAGKSTATQLLNGMFDTIADDLLIIRKIDSIYYCFQTPFKEKNMFIKKKRKKYVIDKIFFIKKAKYFQLKKVNNKEKIFINILKQVYISPDKFDTYLKTANDFVNCLDNFYFLWFMKKEKEMVEIFSKI